MNKPKRHHFVPEMLSKRFADSDGKLFFAHKKSTPPIIGKTIPRNLFSEGHYYSEILKDGSKIPDLEIKLSKLEHDTSLIFDKIENCAGNYKLPDLSKVEREIIDLYLYIQWKRTPDSRNHVFKGLNPKEQIRIHIEDYERETHPIDASEKNKMLTESEVQRTWQNSFVKSFDFFSSEFFASISQKGLGIAKPKKPTKSFIIGSSPVLKLTDRNNAHISHQLSEIWLPISSGLSVVFYGNRRGEKFALLNDANVRSINESISAQSTTIAARSSELIASLVHLKPSNN